MKTVTKPWGKEEWLELNEKYCYKRTQYLGVRYIVMGLEKKDDVCALVYMNICIALLLPYKKSLRTTFIKSFNEYLLKVKIIHVFA